MDPLLTRGARWLRGKLPVAAAVNVEIVSTADGVLAIEAIPGRHDFQQYVVEEAVGTDEVFDFIVAEPDLVFPLTGKQQPAKGWEIRHTREDGRVAVFLVQPGSGTRVFDVVDQLGLMYRVHTILDRLEEAA